MKKNFSLFIIKGTEAQYTGRFFETVYWARMEVKFLALDNPDIKVDIVDEKTLSTVTSFRNGRFDKTLKGCGGVSTDATSDV